MKTRRKMAETETQKTKRDSRQTDRHAGRQAGRKTDKQTERKRLLRTVDGEESAEEGKAGAIAINFPAIILSR